MSLWNVKLQRYSVKDALGMLNNLEIGEVLGQGFQALGFFICYLYSIS